MRPVHDGRGARQIARGVGCGRWSLIPPEDGDPQAAGRMNTTEPPGRLPGRGTQPALPRQANLPARPQDNSLSVLVDRLWPRGIAKQKAHIDLWLKPGTKQPGCAAWWSPNPAKMG